MLKLNEQYGLVSETVDALGSILIPNPRQTYRQVFLVTITVAGKVWIEASVAPTGGGATRWVPITGETTTTDSIFLEGAFPALRLSWSDNTGAISVDRVATGFNPNLY